MGTRKIHVCGDRIKGDTYLTSLHLVDLEWFNRERLVCGESCVLSPVSFMVHLNSLDSY